MAESRRVAGWLGPGGGATASRWWCRRMGYGLRGMVAGGGVGRRGFRVTTLGLLVMLPLGPLLVVSALETVAAFSLPFFAVVFLLRLLLLATGFPEEESDKLFMLLLLLLLLPGLSISWGSRTGPMSGDGAGFGLLLMWLLSLVSPLLPDRRFGALEGEEDEVTKRTS